MSTQRNEKAHDMQLNSIFVRRVHYHCSAEAEVKLKFANRERVRSHDALSISSIYARLSRHIRSAGRYHNALHVTARRDFLLQAQLAGPIILNKRGRGSLACGYREIATRLFVGDAQSGVEHREVQLLAFLAREAMEMVRATRESVIMRQYEKLHVSKEIFLINTCHNRSLSQFHFLQL